MYDIEHNYVRLRGKLCFWKWGKRIIFNQKYIRIYLTGTKFLVLAEEEVAAGDRHRLQFSHSRSVAG